MPAQYVLGKPYSQPQQLPHGTARGSALGGRTLTLSQSLAPFLSSPLIVGETELREVRKLAHGHTAWKWS